MILASDLRQWVEIISQNGIKHMTNEKLWRKL